MILFAEEQLFEFISGGFSFQSTRSGMMMIMIVIHSFIHYSFSG
jgi:hypothetical protein